MDHHDDVGTEGERQAVARLLVAAVAAHLLVAVDGEPERAGEANRVVRARVVDEDELVDDLAVDLADGAGQRAPGVVGG